jgi:lipopolysaccharide/colanic/teichoic acid biosynthesis glycosyltransferase
MRIWPVIIDSQPPYLQGRGRSSSLLMAPLGTSTVIEQLVSSFQPVTGNAPLVIPPVDADDSYSSLVATLSPSVQVVASAEHFADALSGLELSDALLIVDPRCMPVEGFQFAKLQHEHALEPRVSHHLVAFETAVAGTKERVCFDRSGKIRAIQRFYEQATWPFVSGVNATLVPCASGFQAGGFIPRSLAELRQILLSRGVPSRDIPIEGGALDLSEERGLLAANEQLVLRMAEDRQRGGLADGSPVYVGEGHMIHATARVMGPVVLHDGARIDENATVLGPAVIGPGARVQAGSVVAHATVGADCIVPSNLIVRDRTWFSGDVKEASMVAERPPTSYVERLARLSMTRSTAAPVRQEAAPEKSWHLAAKRALDMTASTIGLLLLAPTFLLVAAAVWLESRGPVFYADKREGRGGRDFRCWKFRTMYTGAHLAQRDLKTLDHTDGPHFKVDRDPRVTRVGRILRMLNMDELPQLVNVLTGEMSLVGPRPSPFRENQVCVPWREARLSVRPGITGFWQVCRHNRSEGDFHQWIEYDLLYVQHLSFWLDLKILAATILTLGGKAKSVPSSWLVSSRPAASEAADRTRQVQATASSVLGWRTDVEAIDDRADRGLVA